MDTWEYHRQSQDHARDQVSQDFWENPTVIELSQHLWKTLQLDFNSVYVYNYMSLVYIVREIGILIANLIVSSSTLSLLLTTLNYPVLNLHVYSVYTN